LSLRLVERMAVVAANRAGMRIASEPGCMRQKAERAHELSPVAPSMEASLERSDVLPFSF
jgi:hypothetical protein